jgi:hypothetical protein
MKRAVYILTALAGGLLSGCSPDRPAPEPVTAEENGVHLTALLSSRTVTVADPVTLHLTAEYPATARIEWPAAEQPPELVTRHRQTEPPQTRDGRAVTAEELILAALRPGEYTLFKDRPLRLIQEDGSVISNRMPELTLTVKSTLSGPEDLTLSPLKPAVYPPRKYGTLLRVMGLIALTALLVGLLTRLLLARQRKKAAGPPPKPQPPPHEIALEALRMLKAKNWIEKDQPYLFYSELSLIWRYYLENRFQIHAPESTTEEIAASVQRLDALPGPQREQLTGFLQDADAVKFAKERPGAEQMRESLARCETFIQHTRRDPAETKEAS